MGKERGEAALSGCLWLSFYFGRCKPTLAFGWIIKTGWVVGKKNLAFEDRRKTENRICKMEGYLKQSGIHPHGRPPKVDSMRRPARSFPRGGARRRALVGLSRPAGGLIPAELRGLWDELSHSPP